MEVTRDVDLIFKELAMFTDSHTGGCLTVRPDSALNVEYPTSDLGRHKAIIFNRNEPSSIESGSR